jgi:hypothetical protein
LRKGHPQGILAHCGDLGTLETNREPPGIVAPRAADRARSSPFPAQHKYNIGGPQVETLQVGALQAVVVFIALVVALALVRRFGRAIVTGLALVGGLAMLAILALAFILLSDPQLLDTGGRILEVLR